MQNEKEKKKEVKTTQYFLAGEMILYARVVIRWSRHKKELLQQPVWIGYIYVLELQPWQ